jgi:hypothetical protein
VTCMGVCLHTRRGWDRVWPIIYEEHGIIHFEDNQWIVFASLMGLVWPTREGLTVSVADLGCMLKVVTGWVTVTHRQAVGASGSRLSHSSFFTLQWKAQSSDYICILTFPHFLLWPVYKASIWGSGPSKCSRLRLLQGYEHWCSERNPKWYILLQDLWERGQKRLLLPARAKGFTFLECWTLVS